MSKLLENFSKYIQSFESFWKHLKYLLSIYIFDTTKSLEMSKHFWKISNFQNFQKIFCAPEIFWIS